jgi:hypothetical protein
VLKYLFQTHQTFPFFPAETDEELDTVAVAGNEQRKSVQIATNVLSFTSGNKPPPGAGGYDSCSGCCSDSVQKPPEMYGFPQIKLVNGTLDLIRIEEKSKKNLTLFVEICANPPVDRIIWETPSGQLLKPGQSDRIRRILALQSSQTASKATCSDVKLVLLLAQDLQSAAELNPDKTSISGKYVVMGQNRLGFAEKEIRIEFFVNPEPDTENNVSSATLSQQNNINEDLLMTNKCDRVQSCDFLIVFITATIIGVSVYF